MAKDTDQRFRDLANEDLNKEIPEVLAELREHQATVTPNWQITPIVNTLTKLGALLGNLYVKAERQTAKVVRLTWALLILTAALLFLTGYLCYDAYLNRQRYKAEQSHRAEPNHSDLKAQPTTAP